MLLIHVLILVGITSSLIVITTSATVITLTSSSILVLLCSVIVVPVLLCTALVIVWNAHLIDIRVHISVYLSLKIDELQNVLLRHCIVLLFNICLGSPEIDFNWSSEAKDVGFMIVLDTLLGLLHILV